MEFLSRILNYIDDISYKVFPIKQQLSKGKLVVNVSEETLRANRMALELSQREREQRMRNPQNYTLEIRIINF